MFRIDRDANTITPMKSVGFSALGLRERDHLQEWIANEPSCLGEELLIIQKEFSGFDGTQERLDLLALDKAGRLVIIENKLDDSGRDVIWQALKYASYCSTLKTSQIIDIFRQHLGQSGTEDAREQLADFLPDQSAEDLVLNPSGTQRIMLVAAKFRKEVTATALWLLAKGVNISCFQVTPYQDGAALFLDVSQIIPTPETGDYMIQLAEKSASDDHATGAEAARHARRRAFWDALLATASAREVAMLARKSSSKDNWMTGACGINGVQYSMIITEGEARVQFEFVTADKALNKAMFDLARTHETTFKSSFDDPVIWRRMDDAKSSRIGVASAVDFLDQSTWPDIIEWLLTRLERMEAATTPILPELSQLRLA